jgi:predicted dehydrogenase
MRVGLIGFGSIAEHGHLPALQSCPDVEIGAIADLSADRLDRARDLLPAVSLHASPAELIEQAQVDVLDICTPPHTHAELMVAACRRGIGTIVSEKPFVLSEEEYARVACARAESGARVFSVNNWVHSDLNRRVTDVLRSGMIGKVRRVVLRTGRPDIALGNGGWQPRWRTDPAYSGGGIILDHGWHQLYLLLGWIGQDLESVSAVTRTIDPRHYPVEDDAAVELCFASALGRIELSWIAEGRSNEGEIEATHGHIAIFDERIVVRTAMTERVFPFAGRLTQSSYHPDWFQKMFEHGILDKNREEADRTFAEAGILVGAIGAAYRSARDNGAAYRPRIPAFVQEESVSGSLRSASSPS